jgi:hypothetical protein
MEDNMVFHKVEPFEVREGLYSVVFANCGATSFSISGNLSFLPENSLYLDRRLRLIPYVHAVFFVFMYLYLIVWALRILKIASSPGLFQHLFAFSVIASFVFHTCLGIFFWFLHYKGVDLRFLLTIASVSFALSRTLIYFLSAHAVQYPNEFRFGPYFVSSIIMSMVKVSDLVGITEFANRTTGQWNLGYGSPGCSEFMGICLLCIAIMGYVMVSESSADIESSMFFVFASAFLGYFQGSFAVLLMRLDQTVDDTRNVEWLPPVIEPLFYTILVIGNGRFWLQADRQGWERLHDGTVFGDLGVESALGWL